MRVVTWNVNSLRARRGRVERWIETFAPDVLCLQETKLADSAFGPLEFQALGYESVHHGEGRWNGVAILSRVGLEECVAGFGEGIEPDRDARLVWATCGGVRIACCYVPNGRSLGHDHYHYKLSWLARLRASLEGQADPQTPTIVCGDFNVAPEDRDVYDPMAFTDTTHTSAPEREALENVLDWGLSDLFRLRYEEAGLFSWWDYRAGDFHKRKGMRIDLLLGSHVVADALTYALIDRNERKGPRNDPPSDHAPVFVDLDL